MSLSRHTEVLTHGAARCGRCAEILPDETLTYCLSCGVPFSKIPPTDSYIRFEERHFLRRPLRGRGLAAGLLGLAVSYVVVAFVQAVATGHHVAVMGADRPVDIYFYDAPEYPSLDASVKRLSASIAVQAFEDHFGFAPHRWRIVDDGLPEALEPWHNEGLPSSFAVWEQQLVPLLQNEWLRRPDDALSVVVTNSPIIVDTEAPRLETRHLSDAKIVSGLGHPAFVVVSAFRMLTQDPQYATSRFVIRNEAEQARHLGEYLMAHEMGHALVGLTDIVMPSGRDAAALRGPASVASDTSQCLMHTDAQGGFSAWEHTRARTLGEPSTCFAYNRAREAFEKRARSLELLKEDRDSEARALHLEAIHLAKLNLLPWVAQTWRDEHDAFLSLGERWRKRLLMVQSEE